MSLSSLFSRRPRMAPEPASAPAVELVAAPEPSSPSSADVGVADMIRSGWFNAETDELAPGFPISRQDVVVDVGSGDGGFGVFAARRAQETILVDIDEVRLERATVSVRDQGGRNVRGVASDGAALALPDAVASRVICTEVLEHVDDPAKVMAELVRIGRPGALYLISAPNAAGERLQVGLAWPFYFEKPNHIRIIEPEELTRLAEDAGLVVERRCEHGFFWTLHWMFFWQAGLPLNGSTPLTQSWAKTWDLVLSSPEGSKIKAKLDALAGFTNVLVARKPG